MTGGQYNGTGPFGSGLCTNYCVPPKPDMNLTLQCEGVQETSCPTICDYTATPPHDVYASDKYTYKGHPESPSPNIDAIAQSILEGGSVTARFDVFEDFLHYSGGIYSHVAGSDKALGGHAIRLVGWGVENNTKYWKAANSWGSEWAEQGYFRVVRGSNEWSSLPSCSYVLATTLTYATQIDTCMLTCVSYHSRVRIRSGIEAGVFSSSTGATWGKK